jgi:ATP-dependent RNA helicase RhlE
MSYTFSTRRPARPNINRNYRSSSNKRGSRKQYINPSKFIQAAKPVAEEEAFVPIHSFTDFDINPLIKTNLEKKGVVTPTPIQDQTIPHGLAGKDVVGIANTGTGKTIAFAIPLLNKLMLDGRSRALIMAPTRELAQQIEQECRIIARGSGLHGAVLIGGSPMGPQLGDLRAKPQIVIGTPGRIKDHLERGSLILSDFNIVVLDEVDRMLDMGFIGDIKIILGALLPNRQSFFFSATMEPSVRSVMSAFVHDPVTISVKTGDTSDYVDQNVVTYGSSGEKIDKLHDLLLEDGVKALIFDETQRSVERLHKELVTRGFKAEAIHGGKSQGHRQRALSRFKTNDVQFLVATDVAARGIDVVDITHVINYSTPQSYEDYVHRIGRAGRAGRQGYALTFIEK